MRAGRAGSNASRFSHPPAGGKLSLAVTLAASRCGGFRLSQKDTPGRYAHAQNPVLSGGLRRRRTRGLGPDAARRAGQDSPVPSTVSPQMQKLIGGPLRSNWDLQHKTGEEWKTVAVPTRPRRRCRTSLVYEGQLHAHYLRDHSAPETKGVFTEIGAFFDRHLGR